MNCKDCYHCDVCSREDGTTNYYGKIGACNYVDEMCKYFKSKSRIIELPCKVGEELFLTDYPMVHHRLKEYKFIGTRVVMVIECFELQSTCKRFVDEHFGKTVFADKSKAEKRLKEQNK